MGKKYIIEVKEGERLYKTKLNALNEPVIREIVYDREPYTEPDLEQVRKKAYQKGYETGYEDGYNEPGKNQQEAYQRGLNDAWDAARKIVLDTDKGGIPLSKLQKIFHRGLPNEIIGAFSASEAIEEIRAYEREHEEFHIGDEVIRHYKNEFMEGDDAPSIFLYEEDGNFRCITFNGRSIIIAEYPKHQYRKTGRHFPEIAEVLQKMRENNG